MGEQLFMMDAGYTMASWGKWQKRLFEVARAYDHQLFTEDALCHLAARMEKEARLAPKVAQDSVKVHVSDWHENRKYGCGPYIQIGTYPKAVLVRFIFINGQYVFGSHEFEVANTRKGYVVEAYMPDKDGVERWLPLRNFGERQGDALDFCHMDLPKMAQDLVRGLANTFRTDAVYARIANLAPSVRPYLARRGVAGESQEEKMEREAENLRALYRANGLETTKTS